MTGATAMEASRLDRAFALLFLERSRLLLRTRFGRALSLAVGLLYGVLALFVGGMLELAREPYLTTTARVVVPEFTNAWWDYPAILVTGPWGVLTLPFLPTLTMLVVATGVGIGMSVGIVLTLELRRARRTGGGSALSSAAGFTPAVLALITLGACCSTTAAATAGIGAIAQASGTGLDQLLFNNWYLDLFQVVVLWVALLAQEQLLAIYGSLIGAAGAGVALDAPVRFDRRRAGATALRAALVTAGVVWALAAAATWTAFSPVPLTTGLVAALLLEHGLLAGLALAAGLFASGVLDPLVRGAATLSGRAARVVLGVVGVSLAVYVPPPLAGAGFVGLANEVLGYLGAPASVGAVAPPTATLSVLLLRWTFEFLLLGGFAIAVAVAPARLRNLLDPSRGPTGGVAGRVSDAPSGAPAASVVAAIGTGRPTLAVGFEGPAPEPPAN